MEPNFRSQTITQALRKSVEAEIIDRRLVLEGEFAEEIKYLLELKADVDSKLGMVTTIGQAEALKAEAAAVLQQAKDEAGTIVETGKKQANALLDEAQAMLDSARSRQVEVAKQEALITAARAKLNADIAAQEAAAAKAVDLTRATAKAHSELAAREAAVVTLEQDLATRTDAIIARERRFNAKLDALKMTDD